MRDTAAFRLLDYLVAGLPGSLPQVRVVDGQFLEGDLTHPDVLAIGWRPGGEPAIRVQQQRSTLGNRRTEQITLDCFASCLRGDAGTVGAALARTALSQLLADLDAAVRADPTAAGLVTRLEVGMSGEAMQDQTPDGAMCSALVSLYAERA